MNLIVHESRYVVLEAGAKLIEDCGVCTSVSLGFQLIVGFQDHLISEGKIILASVGTRHGDTRSHWRRGHSQVLDDHVLWARVFRSEAEKEAVIIIDPPKHVVDFVRPKDLLSVSARVQVGGVSVKNHDSKAALSELWFAIATTFLRIALADGLANTQHLVEARLRVFCPPNACQNSLFCVIILRNEKATAVEADTSK